MENVFKELLDILKEKNMTIASAESLTGGLLASSLVDIPGASKCFKEGFVTYCDEAKIRTLGVSKDTIRKYGAISAQTAREMASGAAMNSGCDIAVSTTGNAGPDCDEGKEAGLVYIGIYSNGRARAFEFHFKGGRDSVRKQTAETAASLLMSNIKA